MPLKSSRLDRRRFLEVAGGAAAGALLGPRLARAAALGANDRIRVGVIGTGGRARCLMRLLKALPGCEMVAVCDVYEPRLLRRPRSPAPRPRSPRRLPPHARRQGASTPC